MAAADLVGQEVTGTASAAAANSLLFTQSLCRAEGAAGATLLRMLPPVALARRREGEAEEQLAPEQQAAARPLPLLHAPASSGAGNRVFFNVKAFWRSSVDYQHTTTGGAHHCRYYRPLKYILGYILGYTQGYT